MGGKKLQIYGEYACVYYSAQEILHKILQRYKYVI